MGQGWAGLLPLRRQHHCIDRSDHSCTNFNPIVPSCPADFGMLDVERFHEEAAKDRAVRRK